MKQIQIILTGVMLAAAGCIRAPVSQQATPAIESLPPLEVTRGHKVELSGTIAKGPVPTITVTSHRVGNGQNIVRLRWAQPESRQLPIVGTPVTVTGVLNSEQMKVPTITVDTIKEKTGPNQVSEATSEPAPSAVSSSPQDCRRTRRSQLGASQPDRQTSLPFSVVNPRPIPSC